MAPTWPLPLDGNSAKPTLAEEWMWPRSAADEGPLGAVGPDERYHLKRILATGGQAFIWAAKGELGEDWVVKTLRPDVEVSRPIAARRLLREARILESVARHRHVIELHDWGPRRLRLDHHNDPDDGDPCRDPWLCLPYHQHVLLERALTQHGPLGTNLAVTIGAELAEALAHLHAQNVVHRDISPGNVLLTRMGVVLSDFGVAWSSHYQNDGIPLPMSTGLSVAGRPRTAGWVAPEVMAENGLSYSDRNPQADIFSWGLFVFAALTGRHPWAASTESVELQLTREELKQMYSDTDRSKAITRSVEDRQLRDLLKGALSARPGDRPSAKEISEELHARVASSPSTKPHRAGLKDPARPKRVERFWSKRQRIRARRRLAFIVTSVAMFLAVALIATSLIWESNRTVEPIRIDWAVQPPFAAAGPIAKEQSLSTVVPGWPIGEYAGVTHDFRDGSYEVHPLTNKSFARIEIPGSTNFTVADMTVTATASMRAGQGYWGVWCRGIDSSGRAGYYFEISHTSAIRILEVGASGEFGGTDLAAPRRGRHHRPDDHIGSMFRCTWHPRFARYGSQWTRGLEARSGTDTRSRILGNQCVDV